MIDQITLEEAMIRTGFGGTSTKSIVSIVSPEAVQNDGPNGFNSYTLGQYANTDTDSADPYVIDPDDKNLNYKFGTMSNETVIAQTFSKEMAAEYGAVTGNYSIWSNLPILWGAGTNLHRTPYNARNHEYYSEDAILTAYQAAAYIAAGKEYGCIIAPKHFAFNDTEINRSGIATFMTEQKARENELRGTQASVEDAQTLGMMTTFNRIGCTAGNAHYGLLMNILRKEWGFQGLMSEDFIQDANYSVLKEAVHCGVTMTCNTGDSNMEAVTAKWNYWTTEAVSKDASMMQDLKNVMMWQNYALANSNAMDGLNETSQIKDVRTWYDNALTATSAVLALLTLAAAAMYIRDAKRRKTVKRVCYEFYQKTGCRLLSDAACTNSRNSRNRILCDQLQHGIFFQSWNQLGSCRMSCGRSGSGNSFCGRTGKVAGNAGTGYSSDSGGSAFDGRICIFCPA